jgi:hypothetical protein
VAIKQGNWLKVFGDERIYTVAEVSKTTAGRHLTVYLYASDKDTEAYPLYDVVAREEGDGDTVVGTLWWAKLQREAIEGGEKKKEESGKKKIIKKAQQGTNGKVYLMNNSSNTTKDLAALASELKELREEMKAMFRQLREDAKEEKREERATIFELVKLMSGKE